MCNKGIAIQKDNAMQQRKVLRETQQAKKLIELERIMKSIINVQVEYITENKSFIHYYNIIISDMNVPVCL